MVSTGLATPQGSSNGRDVFTVSRLNLEVRAALENSFPLLWVTGEISNLSQPRSGHAYFSLKDAAAQVRCALFRSRRMNLRFTPQNGQQVLLRGRVTLFEPRGDFQLIVDHMEPAGEGALRQQIEALRLRLAAEGLFDAARKRPLPAYPLRIGGITSPSGAAIRDVLSVLERRWPAAAVILYPVSVQGDQAAEEITRMIATADARAECDLFVLTRGGGSLEDLMAFNDEAVVRAVASCETPVVCAVGHEIDFSLADFAADRRAPTPSAAAELVTPDSAVVSTRLAERASLLTRLFEGRFENEGLKLRALTARLRGSHPIERIMQQQQRTDELEQRLVREIGHRLGRLRGDLTHLQSRLTAQSPRRRLHDAAERLTGSTDRVRRAIGVRLAELRQRSESVARELHAVSPLATLGRGYAIVIRREDGQIVRKAATLQTGDLVDARLAEGGLRCRVEETTD